MLAELAVLRALGISGFFSPPTPALFLLRLKVYTDTEVKIILLAVHKCL